ncbi:hypothetical protein BX666DRAFT_1853194 [Dichotomocladium elegans]|nr:hypothetical protein BX666DRAFT_1853194 [Dichotomocladium elegans]
MVAISSILLLLLGPLIMPRFYLGFLLVYFTCFLYSQINLVFKLWITSAAMIKRIRNWNLSQPSLSHYEGSELIHAFIVPNYAEPEALLRDTVKRLANHRNAQTNYVIILAMEASEQGHKAKAESLAEYFRDSFLHFIITVHPADIPGESRGKGSNVSYAARVACSEMVRRGLDRRRIMLTISDSDSSIPELYVSELEKAFHQADDPHFLLYAPPIFFSRNCFDVPAAVRMTDITWSAMVMANLSNSRGIGFPCSTYSVSQVLAERVGFWDTDADSVGEDMHMMLKCFFKTDGMARCQPIFVPINLTNVQTNGYLSNMHARYVQASRHYNGIADVSYTLRNAFGFGREVSMESVMAVKKTSAYASPTFWIDKLIICIKVFEAHMIPVTSGWLMFAAVPLMQFVMFPPHSMVAIIDPSDNPILTSDFYATLWNIVKIITIFLPFPLFATLAIYEHLHRVVDRELYRKAKSESRTWRNCADYISLPIAAWMFMTIPSTIAALKRLYKTNDQYIVAEKFFKEETSD